MFKHKNASFIIIMLFVTVSLVSGAFFFFKGNSTPDPSQCELTVYTYSSMASHFGAGPAVVEDFQEKHSCTLNFVDVGQGRTLLQRVKTEIDAGGKTRADIVMGLDQFSFNEVLTSNLFVRVDDLRNFEASRRLVRVPENSYLMPYDWAPFTFVFRKDSGSEIQFLESLEGLANPKFKGKFSLMDPRTSSPGYHFFLWLLAENLQDSITIIKKNAHSIVPSWTSNYGLFKKGDTEFAFTYLTSVVFHEVEEKDSNFIPFYGALAMPYQVEYAGVLKSSQNKEKALEFLSYLISPDAQEILMKKNYMLPVVAGVEEGTPFANLPQPDLLEYPELVEDQRVFKMWEEN